MHVKYSMSVWFEVTNFYRNVALTQHSIFNAVLMQFLHEV